MVNKCRIYDEENRAMSTHNKSVNSQKDKKSSDQNRGKLYLIPSRHQNTFGNHKSSHGSGRGNGNGNGNNRWGTSTPKSCRKCGRMGHRAVELKNAAPTCFNCGKYGHINLVRAWRRNQVVVKVLKPMGESFLLMMVKP